MLKRTCIALLLAITLLSGQETRPKEWAQPVMLAGVPNLHQLDGRLYRSAQPSKEGMKNLEKLGVRKTINLRAFHSDSDEVEGTSLLNEELSIFPWKMEDEDVIRVLKIVSDSTNGPYLIHCQHGADRTGMMCAMYRMVIQGWPRDEAIKEMVDGGYGFHAIWKNIIEYLENVDMGKIRKKINER